jgi:hypothetical protein
MRCFPWIAFGLVALTASVAAQESPSQSAANDARAEARKISAELTDQLRLLLGQEMAQGGIAGAVRVCSEVALRTTKNFSKEKGRYVRRVSLKNRNPENAPDPYERQILEWLSQQQRDGKLPEEFSEIRTDGKGETLLYFKPVVIGAMCLGCHGPAADLSPEVKNILAEKYPKDTATGYAAGDLRGAIAVRIPLAGR